MDGWYTFDGGGCELFALEVMICFQFSILLFLNVPPSLFAFIKRPFLLKVSLFIFFVLICARDRSNRIFKTHCAASFKACTLTLSVRGNRYLNILPLRLQHANKLYRSTVLNSLFTSYQLSQYSLQLHTALSILTLGLFSVTSCLACSLHVWEVPVVFRFFLSFRVSSVMFHFLFTKLLLRPPVVIFFYSLCMPCFRYSSYWIKMSWSSLSIREWHQTTERLLSALNVPLDLIICYGSTTFTAWFSILRTILNSQKGMLYKYLSNYCTLQAF